MIILKAHQEYLVLRYNVIYKVKEDFAFVLISSKYIFDYL